MRTFNYKFFLRFLILSLIILFSFQTKVFSTEQEILEKLAAIEKDLKTLEKAVYSENNFSSESANVNSNISTSSEDSLTRHLLKLSEVEEQFQQLTNKFEEINFKLDKLSKRISKIQADNQLRFQDLEKSGVVSNKIAKTEKKELPGSSEATELGRISESDTEIVQQTQSVESTSSVTTEKFQSGEKLLPSGTPKEQYDFAISLVKVGDYDTAEIALREFVDTQSEHELAGNALYWYAETYRIRRLYNDAATAYLEGYQRYPKSSKAPINLLKLGVSLVQIGEKDQGCLMITGVSKQYPKASQSVLQKAKYEEKKFDCQKKNS